ncbi:MAG: AzlC family ABC transporter permease [Clostridiaceae bacterium]|nr:AzlC family ABC transporter permease [Clostridiaceae bacterium]
MGNPQSEHKLWYRRGIRDGVPIALGYFAVAFTLGIAAKKAGFTALQAFVCSFTINASAGQYAGIALISAGAGLLEIAVMEAVANARYLLMSAALSQKLDPKMPFFHRFLIGYDVTDEIFGISVSVTGKLDPFYTYGAMTMALPGWACGAMFGVICGTILPVSVVSALGVGVYGMFIAIIVPPARKSKIIAGVITVSVAASYVVSKLAFFAALTPGLRTILLTVALATAAALLFPVKTEKTEETT